jgi:hypothetical protein
MSNLTKEGYNGNDELSIEDVKDLLARVQVLKQTGAKLPQSWNDLAQIEHQANNFDLPDPANQVHLKSPEEFQEYVDSSVTMNQFVAVYLSKVVNYVAARLFKEHNIKFFLKISIFIQLINVETAELNQGSYLFPKEGTWRKNYSQTTR